MEKTKKEAKNEEIAKQNTIIMIIKYVLPIVVALIIFAIFKMVTGTYRMSEIDLNKYTSLVSGKKQSMIFVISNDCDTCTKTEDLLKKMLQGSNIKTYEINIDKLTDEEKDKFMDTLTETSDGMTAPALLMVKEYNLLSSFYGPFDEDLIIEFLQENNLVEKAKTSEQVSEQTNE